MVYAVSKGSDQSARVNPDLSHLWSRMLEDTFSLDAADLIIALVHSLTVSIENIFTS